MKRIIFLLIILGCLLFCGCAATADIEYGIDTDNTAYTRITVNLNAGDMSALDKNNMKLQLRHFETYYRNDMGFESEYDFFTENENTAYLVLTKVHPCDSFEEAFETLKSMLCDEGLTAFSALSCELSDTAPELAYRINGSVELNRVLENIYNSGISKGSADYAVDLLENCSFSVTMSLPHNTEIYRLSHTEVTEITHEGKLFCVSGRALGSDMSDTVMLYLKSAIYIFGAITVIGVAGMTLGIVFIKKGKRKYR